MARLRVSNRTEALCRILEARIARGEYKKGERMPPERDLSDELSYARNTVRKAYQALNHRGLLDYRARGYWTSEKAISFYPARESEKRQYYALFIHGATVDSHLLAALEKRIRQEGADPLIFNLQSLPDRSAEGDLLKVLSSNIEGAFFLSTGLGSLSRHLSLADLENLPLPWVFVGCDPLFESGAVVDTAIHFEHWKKQSEFQNQRWRIYLPWPLSCKERECLTQLNQLRSNGLFIQVELCEGEQIAVYEGEQRMVHTRLNFLKESFLRQSVKFYPWTQYPLLGPDKNENSILAERSWKKMQSFLNHGDIH